MGRCKIVRSKYSLEGLEDYLNKKAELFSPLVKAERICALNQFLYRIISAFIMVSVIMVMSRFNDKKAVLMDNRLVYIYVLVALGAWGYLISLNKTAEFNRQHQIILDFKIYKTRVKQMCLIIETFAGIEAYRKHVEELLTQGDEESVIADIKEGVAENGMGEDYFDNVKEINVSFDGIDDQIEAVFSKFDELEKTLKDEGILSR